MPSSEQTDQAIPAYDPDDYPRVAVTVDIVVFTIVDDDLRVLLVQRGEPPFLGRWALPGGFVRPDEDLDRAPDGEWSLRQVLEHIMETEDSYLPRLEQALTDAVPG